jgi:8-oxo-dGTP pyrophosphatase MutT (NUDIX family)
MTQILFGERIGQEGKVRPGCIAILFDRERQKVLLTRRADTGQWCLPSGGLEAGESLAEACERETLEETGVVVKVKKLVSIFSSPDRLVIYPDGNKAQILGFAFEVDQIGGQPGLSDETTEVGYFSPDEIRRLDIFPHHKQFIEDALKEQSDAFIR